jgi:hypothetical protein
MSYMKDFSWRYFESTGEIDAYLLYKAFQNLDQNSQSDAEQNLEQEVEARME